MAKRKPVRNSKALVSSADGDVLEKTPQVQVPGASTAYFAPGQPMRPMAPPDQAGRALDYPIGWNYRTQPRANEPISFWELYALAEFDDITRLLIETRKDQLEALDWGIRLVDADENDTPDPDQQTRIDQCEAFFDRPDGEHSFGQWVRLLLEDLLVFDAPAVYINRDEPGNTKFEVVSGMTINRVIDGRGRTPPAPYVAYQQVIKGMPAWDYSTDEMLYMPRNLRPNRIYGMPPTQQIIMTVNIALRKQNSQLQFYTEGTIPDALIGVPESWTTEQIASFQAYWDSILEGNTASRRHAKFVPGGMKIEQTKAVQLKDDFDEWLTRVRCYAFSIPPTAFIKQMNRATAATAKEAATEEGLAPLMKWAKQFVDTLLQRYLGQKDLEFAWAEQDNTDPQAKVDTLDKQLGKAAITLNEYREAMGRDGYGADGDKPIIFLPSGPVLLSSVLNPPEPTPMPAGQVPGQDNGKAPPKPGQPAPPAAKDQQAATNGAGKKAPASGPQNGVDKVKKAVPKTLYVHRPLLNGQDVVDWAKANGFDACLTPDDLHVTVAYSKDAVDWDQLPTTAQTTVRVSAGPRSVEPLGDKGAVVLKFASQQLQTRHRDLKDAGASWDWPSYQPHVTLTYDGADVDLNDVEPYDGPLLFGPEVFAEVDDGWSDNVVEKAGVAETGAVPFADPPDAIEPVIKVRKGHRGTPLPMDTVALKRDQRRVERALNNTFRKLAAKVAAQFRNRMGKLAKAEDDPDNPDATADFDISDLDVLASGTLPEALTASAASAGLQTLLSLGLQYGGETVLAVNQNALDYATERAAELVGKKWVPISPGSQTMVLIDNPDAQWAITQSTRDYLRDLIAQGMDEGVGIDGIADLIASLPEAEGLQAFTPARATLIARSETLSAHNAGALAGYQQAQSTGVDILKEWWADAEACPICLENADAGPLPLGAEFPSGDLAPTAHPRCECSIVPYLPDGEADDGGSEDDAQAELDDEVQDAVKL